MYKFFSFLVLFSCVNISFAQFAIVNDNDGYVNVRKSAEINRNNIIDTLQNGSIVYAMEELNTGNWTNIDFRNTDNNGYVYSNRLTYIDKYPTIIRLSESNNKIIFCSNNLSIEIKIKPFDVHQHKISRSTVKTYTFISKIDGKDFWGTDGEVPKFEYKYISISKNNEKYFLPTEALENLFEPNFNFTTVHYDKENDVIYIQSTNSDGAGGYVVAWKIEKGIYKERAIFYGF